MDVSLPETRQEWLARRLAAGAPVVAREMAQALGVSVDTVRRDIIALAAAGQARRVRGGAVPVKAPDAPMEVKIARGAGPSAGVVAGVRAHIGAARTLLLDGGSTTRALAQVLDPVPGLLVMTPSPWVAVACTARGIEVYLIGGHLAPGGGVATGDAAETGLGGVAADVAVLGACGLDPRFGLSADHDGEARVKRAMAAAAAEVVVPASAARLGLRARYRALDPGEIDLVVTDAAPALTRGLAEQGIEVTHV